MAIRGPYQVVADKCDLVATGVASAGMVGCYSTATSGTGFGDTAGKVSFASSPSGLKPVGLLMHEVVNIDTTLYRLNPYKDEINIGSRCRLMRKGWVNTDKVTGSPTAGDDAYLTTAGVLTPTVSSTGGTVATPLVGKFETAKDESGYAQVAIDLP